MNNAKKRNIQPKDGVDSPAESDLRSFSALQKWDAQVYGFRLPESEFHQTWDSTSDGRVKGPRDFPGSHYLMTTMMNTKKYAKIPVPALAIFAIPHVEDNWMTESTDPGVRKAAETYFTSSIFWQTSRQSRSKMAYLARV